MLIVIEGADGCGKTSVASAIAERYSARLIQFPNDLSVTGPMIRAYLKKEWWVERGTVHDSQMGALAFQALQVMNRMEVMSLLLDASLSDEEAPRVVLARYWQSGWVYGQLDGLDAAFLEKVHETMAEPDLNILLNLSPEESMRRRAARDGALPPERYEGRLDFTKRVVDLYKRLWGEHEHSSRWRVVDAMQPLDSVIENCIAEVSSMKALDGL